MRISRLLPDFSQHPKKVARQLIGCALLFHDAGGRIVETEAYDQDDPASHSYVGPTARNQVTFDAHGKIYVYRSYGIHWCFNLVCREEGRGAAVLIRAIEPLWGLEEMKVRRKTNDIRLLCSGPGRLSQALGITREQNGMRIDMPPFQLLPREQAVKVVSSTRIGISKAVRLPWRFCLADSPFLSRRA